MIFYLQINYYFFIIINRSPAILSLAMSAGKFEDRLNHCTSNIQSYFRSPKKKMTSDSSTHNVSDIDTVIGLLDTEPGLSNTSNNKIMDATTVNPLPSTKNSTPLSTDISRFFNVQVPSTSKSFIQETINDEQETTTTNESLQQSPDLFEDTEPIIEPNVLTNTVNVSISTKNSLLEIEKPTVKGFFARKLEERSRLENSDNASEFSTNTSELKPLQQSSTLCKDSKSTIANNPSTRATNVSGDSNNTSPEIEKPQIKGFFARKLEEKSRTGNLLVTSGAVAVADELQSSINIDAPSTSTSEVAGTSTSSCPQTAESNLSVHQLSNDYSDLDPELTSLCKKCSRRIPIWEEDEHSDYHMAMDLSKELRNEPSFKKLPTTNLTKQPKTAKKRGRSSKSATTCKKPTQQNTIDSFFR